jgi:hypothetical protein
MKNTRDIRLKKMFFISGLVILSFGIQIVLWAPHMSAPAHAQGYSHVNWYHGQASVAEKELRAKEQNARMEHKNDRRDTPTHIAVSDDHAKSRTIGFDTADSPAHAKQQRK